MDRRDLEEIERFLASVGKANLFAYYGLAPDAPAEAIEEALKKRRTWAQGQQSNPKYKSEALFLIKSNTLLRRVLIDELDAYRAHVTEGANSRNLDALTLFVRGTLAGGVLTPQAEAAIHHQGRQLELSEAVVAQRIDEILREIGGRREGAGPVDDDLGVDATAIDFYDLLGVPDTATVEQIEAAYRARYRWARSLKDLKKSAEVLQHLDDGWRILKDPAKRKKYDTLRTHMLEVTDEVEKRAATLLGLLGAPAGPGSTSDVEKPPAAPPPLPPVDPSMSAPRPSGEAPRPAEPPRPVEAAPSRPSVEAPVPSVQGRTLDLASGPQNVRTRGPRLQLEGPETVQVKVAQKPLRYGLVVKNVGQGRMPGRVTSDQPWLEIQQARLEPGSAAQTVGIVLHPDRMPRGRASGVVTVATDHGERKTVTFQANRGSWMPLAAGAAVLAMLLLIGFAGVVFALLPGAGSSGPAKGGAAGLALTIDPPADRIVVNDQEIGKGASALVPVPADGAPIHLVVQADGFAPHEELITLKPGQRAERAVTLALEDPMDWAPPKGSQATKLGADAVTALQGRSEALRACFAGSDKAQADYTAWVTAEGTVRKIEVAKSNFPAEAALPCIRRVFRATHLAPFDGTYAIVKATIAVDPAVASATTAGG